MMSRKGGREIVMGLLWIAGGVAITVCTYAMDIKVYFVAWGPVVYGVVVLFRGIINLARGR
ncbi:hypothetical protein [Dactylosporangium sp. CA-092794]|uniref:hypothetical protein n=1 Tax=Dactylosporangium sp. CA-092794 TaxID=3239929 RepID=UPI003D8BAD70